MLSRLARTACLIPLAVLGCRARPSHPLSDFTLPPGGWAEVLARRAESLRSFEALASLELESPDRSGTFDGVLVYQAPDRFRLRAFKRLGPTVFDCLVANGEVRQYWPDRGVVTVRSASASSVPGELRLFAWLTPASANAIVRGADPGSEMATVTLHERPSGRMLREVLLAAIDGRVAFEIFYGDDGKPVATLAYDEYGPENGVDFPHLVKVDASGPGGRVRLTCRLRRVTVNGPLAPRAFDLTLPEGVVEERK